MASSEMSYFAGDQLHVLVPVPQPGSFKHSYCASFFPVFIILNVTVKHHTTMSKSPCNDERGCHDRDDGEDKDG